MTSDPTDGVIASYDAENRIASAAKSGLTTSYVYDADGNRVEKITPPPPATPASGTLYWYMTPGIVAESDLVGHLKSEYVFFNGERVARRDFDASTGAATGVFYYFSDHLKTASVITDADGNIKAESDYYPWGGELQFVNNDPNHYKFTGKERDTESGLDYFGARYYSNGLGRFITPDWSTTPIPVPYADLTDPQSLNLYTYVRNIPTTKVDADGHCDWCRDAWDFGTGVVQGIVVGASWGAVGAPKSSDSNASLAGQMLGTAIEGGVSTNLAAQGGGDRHRWRGRGTRNGRGLAFSYRHGASRGVGWYCRCRRRRQECRRDCERDGDTESARLTWSPGSSRKTGRTRG